VNPYLVASAAASEQTIALPNCDNHKIGVKDLRSACIDRDNNAVTIAILTYHHVTRDRYITY
jgi:hypothetical protein